MRGRGCERERDAFMIRIVVGVSRSFVYKHVSIPQHRFETLKASTVRSGLPCKPHYMFISACTCASCSDPRVQTRDQKSSTKPIAPPKPCIAVETTCAYISPSKLSVRNDAESGRTRVVALPIRNTAPKSTHVASNNQIFAHSSLVSQRDRNETHRTFSPRRSPHSALLDGKV